MSLHQPPWPETPTAILIGAKPWAERGFDECAFEVHEIGPLKLYCALPARGLYCAYHRALIDGPQERIG